MFVQDVYLCSCPARFSSFLGRALSGKPSSTRQVRESEAPKDKLPVTLMVGHRGHVLRVYGRYFPDPNPSMDNVTSVIMRLTLTLSMF